MCVDCIISRTIIASFTQSSRSDKLSSQTLAYQDGYYLERKMLRGGLCTKLSFCHELAFWSSLHMKGYLAHR